MVEYMCVAVTGRINLYTSEKKDESKNSCLASSSLGLTITVIARYIKFCIRWCFETSVYLATSLGRMSLWCLKRGYLLVARAVEMHMGNIQAGELCTARCLSSRWAGEASCTSAHKCGNGSWLQPVESLLAAPESSQCSCS